MKKYILKYNDGTELRILKQSDRLYDILRYLHMYMGAKGLKKCSVWMDGKVLE